MEEEKYCANCGQEMHENSDKELCEDCEELVYFYLIIKSRLKINKL